MTYELSADFSASPAAKHEFGRCGGGHGFCGDGGLGRRRSRGRREERGEDASRRLAVSLVAGVFFNPDDLVRCHKDHIRIGCQLE